MSMFVVIPLTPVLLDILLPLNESRSRILAIDVEFRVDTNEYFTPIFCYTTAIIVVGVSIMVCVDTMHFTCTTHACSLFSIIGWVRVARKLNDIPFLWEDNATAESYLVVSRLKTY